MAANGKQIEVLITPLPRVSFISRW